MRDLTFNHTSITTIETTAMYITSKRGNGGIWTWVLRDISQSQ